MIRETKPIKAVRSVVLARILAFTLTLAGAISMTHPSNAQAQAASPTTSGVMVILTVKSNVTREQVVAVMPAEIRETVQLYLNGKIREWYSRGDGRGAVFLLDARDVAEAHAVMEALPLARQNLIDHEYIAVGPLMPLRLLMASPSASNSSATDMEFRR